MAALDDKLTPDDLDGIIEEIDEDGSGTIDFDGIYIDIFHIIVEHLLVAPFIIIIIYFINNTLF